MTSVLAALLISTAASAAVRPRASEALPRVAIQPLGVLEPAVVRAVTERIGRTFAAQVTVLPARPLPRAAFYRPRQRYRGERILESLEASKPGNVAAILGLMSRDLSATKGSVYDWGVMGLASPAAAAGVVSTHRLGRYAPASALIRRAGQVAVHELGHSFGLAHCPAPRCIMNDAHGGIARVDRSSGRFCAGCRSRLGGLLRE